MVSEDEIRNREAKIKKITEAYNALKVSKKKKNFLHKMKERYGNSSKNKAESELLLKREYPEIFPGDYNFKKADYSDLNSKFLFNLDKLEEIFANPNINDQIIIKIVLTIAPTFNKKNDKVIVSSSFTDSITDNLSNSKEKIIFNYQGQGTKVQVLDKLGFRALTIVNFLELNSIELQKALVSCTKLADENAEKAMSMLKKRFSNNEAVVQKILKEIEKSFFRKELLDLIVQSGLFKEGTVRKHVFDILKNTKKRGLILKLIDSLSSNNIKIKSSKILNKIRHLLTDWEVGLDYKIVICNTLLNADKNDITALTFIHESIIEMINTRTENAKLNFVNESHRKKLDGIYKIKERFKKILSVENMNIFNSKFDEYVDL